MTEDNLQWHENFASEIQYRLRYDAERGELIWIHPRQRRFKGTVAGHIPKSGYGYISLGKFRYPIAQCVWAYHNRWLPERIFRKDGNPRNHRIENLYV
jgi:hypothetical protein